MRRLFGGVRGRVTLTVFAVTAVLYALLGTLLFLRIVDSGRESVEQRVDEVLDRMEADLRAGVPNVRVDTADGVSAVLSDGSTTPDERPGELVVVRTIPTGAGDGQLVGRASLRALNDGLRPLHLGLWVTVPLAAVFTATVAGMATGRALRPVHDITTLASRIGPAAAERVPVPDTGDEIERLATTVNDMLERIADGRRMLERFTSDAAHELRTPLMALQGEIELAERGHGDTESTMRMARQASRLAVLVDDLVLLATLDEGRPLRREAIDLVPFVEGEVATVAPDADVEGIDVTVTADVQLLGRAVDNLLANARRHATSRIRVVVEHDDREVAIHVDDDGPGIPAASADAVFDRFGRLDDARSVDGGGGSGLGLAIVAAVVRSHGGRAEASCSPWGGARLTLRLPR